MAVRSRRLFGPIQVPVGTTTVFTCPGGRTARLALWYGFNGSAATGRITLHVNGNTSAFQVDGTANLAPGDGARVPLGAGAIVLEPGDTLRVVVTGGAMTVVGHGTLLLGAPA